MTEFAEAVLLCLTPPTAEVDSNGDEWEDSIGIQEKVMSKLQHNQGQLQVRH